MYSYCMPLMHFGCYTHISVHTHKNLWRPDCTSLVNQQIITGKLITIKLNIAYQQCDYIYLSYQP